MHVTFYVTMNLSIMLAAFTMKLPPGHKFKGNLDPFVPPKQIWDLQVAGVSRRQGTILLCWTAVGANDVSSAHNVAKYKVTTVGNCR